MNAHHNSNDAHTLKNISYVALSILFTRCNSFSFITVVNDNNNDVASW